MKKILVIPLKIYRLNVVVCWEDPLEKFLKYARNRGCSIPDDEIAGILNSAKGASGIAVTIGKESTDVLIWMKKRPRKASEYGTLYHELYHAVDNITETHNLTGEKEARAFIYEYLLYYQPRDK